MTKVIERISHLKKNHSSILVDIHSHNPEGKENILRLVNIRVGETATLPVLNEDCFYSAGIHPWDITQDFDLIPKLDQLEKLAAKKEILAVGESGIDRAHQIDLIAQKLSFTTHIELAKKVNKPLILHTVRAHSDVMEILKKENFAATQLPLIHHDYRGGPETTEQYGSYRNFFSFGSSLWQEGKHLEVFRALPLNQIFLETDDQCQFSLEDIFIKAAELKAIPPERLQDAMVENFKALFGK